MGTSSQSNRLVNVARFLPEVAERRPHDCAIASPLFDWRKRITGYDTVSFKELELKCGRLSRFFMQQGLRSGSRALVMVRPGVDLLLVTFTLFRLGIVPILIDPGMGLRSFLRCVGRSQPEVLIGIPLAHYVSRLFPKPFQTVCARIIVGGEAYKRALKEDSPQEIPEQVHTTATTLAAILFTSGSTGIPKGVCYEHGMFEAQIQSLRKTFEFGQEEVDLPMLPIFALFNPALGMTTIVPAMNPSRPATVNPRDIVTAIQQWRVTNSFGSPVLWKKIAEYCQKQNLLLPSIRRILIAGAPVSPQVLRNLKEVIPNGEAFTPYGATECLPVSVLSASEILNKTWKQTELGKGTCVGRLFKEMEALILPVTDGVRDVLDRNEQLETGVIGEIVVQGPVMTKEYDQLPEETAKAKIQDREEGKLWHRMGDVGYRDTEGKLWFCGRKAERVFLEDGETLFTECVEAVFNRHPKVFRTALIGLKDRRGNRVAALVIEPEKGQWPGRVERKVWIEELQLLAKGTGGLQR